MLLAGPSNSGLAEPGQGTATSLGRITVALLETKTNMDTLVASTILMMLMDEIMWDLSKMLSLRKVGR